MAYYFSILILVLGIFVQGSRSEVTILGTHQKVSDISPTLHVKGSGFESTDVENIVLEFSASGKPPLVQGQDFNIQKDEDGLVLTLSKGKKWVDLAGRLPPVSLVVTAVKFKSKSAKDSDVNLLPEPVIVARVTRTGSSEATAATTTDAVVTSSDETATKKGKSTEGDVMSVEQIDGANKKQKSTSTTNDNKPVINVTPSKLSKSSSLKESTAESSKDLEVVKPVSSSVTTVVKETGVTKTNNSKVAADRGVEEFIPKSNIKKIAATSNKTGGDVMLDVQDTTISTAAASSLSSGKKSTDVDTTNTVVLTKSSKVGTGKEEKVSETLEVMSEKKSVVAEKDNTKGSSLEDSQVQDSTDQPLLAEMKALTLKIAALERKVDKLLVMSEKSDSVTNHKNNINNNKNDNRRINEEKKDDVGTNTLISSAVTATTKADVNRPETVTMTSKKLSSATMSTTVNNKDNKDNKRSPVAKEGAVEWTAVNEAGTTKETVVDKAKKSLATAATAKVEFIEPPIVKDTAAATTTTTTRTTAASMEDADINNKSKNNLRAAGAEQGKSGGKNKKNSSKAGWFSDTSSK